MKEAYVYILQSEATLKYYVGSCTDIDRRFAEHARGHTRTTRIGGPWKALFVLPCATLAEARALERKIKKWKSKKMTERFMDANPSAQLVEQPRF